MIHDHLHGIMYHCIIPDELDLAKHMVYNKCPILLSNMPMLISFALQFLTLDESLIPVVMPWTDSPFVFEPATLFCCGDLLIVTADLVGGDVVILCMQATTMKKKR